MRLLSRLFRGDPKLEACLVDHSAHLVIGASGEHVTKIHHALASLDGSKISRDELLAKRYGPWTAAAVLVYKQKRKIINLSYQKQADNIVGKMTIASLDKELAEYQQKTRHLLHPMWNALIPVTDPEAEDNANHYFNRSRTLSSQGGQAMMVKPEPGHMRATICKTAHRASTGGRFDPIYWSVFEPKSTPPSADTIKTQWCGIYATWIWAQAGLQVGWRDSIGPFRLASGKRLMTSTKKEFIAPGDIIVDGTTVRYIEKNGEKVAIHPLHHLLVRTVSADHKRASVLEGNFSPNNENQTQSIVNKRDYDLGPINYFYSVDSYRWPDINYGVNY